MPTFSKRPRPPNLQQTTHSANLEILSQQTISSANHQDSWPANDSANLQGDQQTEKPPANHLAAPTSKILGQPTQRILVLRTSLSGNFSRRQFLCT